MVNIVSTLSLYGKSLLKASRCCINSPALLVGPICLGILFWLGSSIIRIIPLGYAGGLVLGLLSSFLLSFYYSWLRECIQSNKLVWSDLTRFDGSLFLGIINVGFLYWMISLITDMILVPIDPRFDAIVSLLIFILLNVTAEMIYIEGNSSLSAFTESLEFVKENWVEWFIPTILICLPIFLVNSWIAISVALGFTPFLPIYPILSLWLPLLESRFYILGSFSPFITIFFLSIVGTTIMLFRGFLYKELSTSTRKSRNFSWSSKK